MGEFLGSAYKVLLKEGRPLSAREITAVAVKEKLLSTGGLTPWQTMKAKLSVDILRNGPRSLFMRSDKGRFALREWESDYRDTSRTGTKRRFSTRILSFFLPSP